tara:strand:+ start:166 stop:432 length:267 start_codon:yes stop_codon:yes gene_type:complete
MSETTETDEINNKINELILRRKKMNSVLSESKRINTEMNRSSFVYVFLNLLFIIIIIAGYKLLMSPNFSVTSSVILIIIALCVAILFI